MMNRDPEALLAARLEPLPGIYLLAPTVTGKRRKRESVNQLLKEGLEMKSRQLWTGGYRSCGKGHPELVTRSLLISGNVTTVPIVNGKQRARDSTSRIPVSSARTWTISFSG